MESQQIFTFEILKFRLCYSFIITSCLLHLRVCQGELPRHVNQVTLLRVTLHPHVAVLLHFRRMRPVLVALGLPEHDINRQIISRVIRQDTVLLPLLHQLQLSLIKITLVLENGVCSTWLPEERERFISTRWELICQFVCVSVCGGGAAGCVLVLK